jgi:hypothetical protein
MTFWIKSPAPMVFDAYFDESYTASADGEEWATSTPITVAGDNAWHKQTVLISSMVSGGGNGIPDVQSIGYVWFFLKSTGTGGVYVDPANTFWIDDIAFEP